MPEQKNILKQRDKYKWRENPPKNFTREDIEEAFALAADTECQKCDCWNTSCPYYDDCKACLVFHMRIDQFPTCQRAMLEDWGVDYIGKTSTPSTK